MIQHRIRERQIVQLFMRYVLESGHTVAFGEGCFEEIPTRKDTSYAGKGERQMVLALINTVFAQDAADAASAQRRVVADQLCEKFPKLSVIPGRRYRRAQGGEHEKPDGRGA
jgi:hypothetical protein